MERKKIELGTQSSDEPAINTPSLDSLVSLEEMGEVQSHMTELLHRMVDACVALAGPGKPGRN